MGRIPSGRRNRPFEDTHSSGTDERRAHSLSARFVATARLAGGQSSAAPAADYSVADALYRTDNMRSIVRLPQVKSRLGLSRSTIYKMVQEGRLAKPIALGARAVGWLNSDIEEFLDERIAASRKVVQ
jgi:prophage regulatory protein